MITPYEPSPGNRADLPVNEEDVETLILMGFANETDIRHALRMAKNDINDAVSYLTMEVPGLTKFGESAPSTSASQTEANTDDVDGTNLLQFPVHQMYDLQSRVMSSSNWNVPYKMNESLGLCLQSAIALAKEQLCDTDENCKKFIQKSMMVSFDKLLTADEVMTWNDETIDGIVDMLLLCAQLAAIRLQWLPIDTDMLKTLQTLLNPHNNYYKRTKNKPWVVMSPDEKNFATGKLEKGAEYGYLLSVINCFGEHGGFDALDHLFETQFTELNATMFMNLLAPFAPCARYLDPERVGARLRQHAHCVTLFVHALDDTQLKNECLTSVVSVLQINRDLNAAFNKEYTYDLDQKALDLILHMLKSTNFANRMQALKEVTRQLESISEKRPNGAQHCLPTKMLSDWLQANNVLLIALEGNLDQTQYVERLKTLLAFLGPRLNCTEISKIWQLRKGRTAVVVDNIYRIIGQAASKFAETELDHLLALVERSMRNDDERNRERVIRLLATVGDATVLNYTRERVVQLLWKIAFTDQLQTALILLALEEQYNIMKKNSMDKQIMEHIYECLKCLKTCTMPSHLLLHMTELITAVTPTATSSSVWSLPKDDTFPNTHTGRKHKIIRDLVTQHNLIDVLANVLVKAQEQALAVRNQQNVGSVKPLVVTAGVKQEGSTLAADKTHNQTSPLLLMTTTAANNERSCKSPTLMVEVSPNTVMPDGKTYRNVVDSVFDMIKFILAEGGDYFYLNWKSVKQFWEILMEAPTPGFTCAYNQQKCFEWFMDYPCTEYQKPQYNEVKVKLLNEKLLALNPTDISERAFACFCKYFTDVNQYKNKLQRSFVSSQKVEVLDSNLTGVDFIWDVALSCTNCALANDAAQFLIDLSYTNLQQKKKTDSFQELHEDFLRECWTRIESCLMAVRGSMVARGFWDVAKTCAAVAAPSIASVPPGEQVKLKLKIERVLLLACRYIRSVEAMQYTPRKWPRHGLTYFMPHPFPMQISCDSSCLSPWMCDASTSPSTTDATKSTSLPAVSSSTTKSSSAKDSANAITFDLTVHSGETLRSVRERVAKRFHSTNDVLRVELCRDGEDIDYKQDQLSLSQLNLVPTADNPLVKISAKRSTSTYLSHHDINGNVHNERMLPSALMALRDQGQVFVVMDELMGLQDAPITRAVTDLLTLMPNDPHITNICDSIKKSTVDNTSSVSHKLKQPGILAAAVATSAASVADACNSSACTNGAVVSPRDGKPESDSAKANGGPATGNGNSNSLERKLKGTFRFGTDLKTGSSLSESSADSKGNGHDPLHKEPSGEKEKSMEKSGSSGNVLASTAAALKTKLTSGRSGHSRQASNTSEFHVPLNTPSECVSMLLNAAQPERLLYNIEVLCGYLLPASLTAESMSSAQHFASEFVAAEGVMSLVNVLHRDNLPAGTDAQLKLNIHSHVLHLLGYLFCSKSTLHDIVQCEIEFEQGEQASKPSAAAGSSTLKIAPSSMPMTSPSPVKAGAAASSSLSFIEVAQTLADNYAGLHLPVMKMAKQLRSSSTDSSTDDLNSLTLELSSLMQNVQRVAWLAAAGMCRYANSVELHSPRVHSMGSPMSMLVSASFGSTRFNNHNRNSESSTGSNDSAESSAAAGNVHGDQSVHSALINARYVASFDEQRLAVSCVALLVDCVLAGCQPKRLSCGLEHSNWTLLFNLPHMADFLVDLLLLTPSVIIRDGCLQQLQRLVKADNKHVEMVTYSTPSGSLGLGQSPAASANGYGVGNESPSRAGPIAMSPRWSLSSVDRDGQTDDPSCTPTQILLNMLIRAPLPLWHNSSHVRGWSRRLLAQCQQYFTLRCFLLEQLNSSELSALNPSLSEMIDTEMQWLMNFSCGADKDTAETDTMLLTGHMSLLTVLLQRVTESRTDGDVRRSVGLTVIKPLITQFIFPASYLLSTVSTTSISAEVARKIRIAEYREKCQTADGREACFQLLRALCKNVPENFIKAARLLTELHHKEDPDIVKVWDYQPLVDLRASCGYVGLKNAGATCYMNSVLQQFLMQPGLPEALLGVELDQHKDSLLNELQRMFAHLRETQQQYYTPRRFWDTFKLWGEHVNPREQHDAFEFFTSLVDQIDTELKKSAHSEQFRARYQGVFSDQKICNGCPHTYEREEQFYAINLPLRARGLEDSLDQFVNGEILEGDNAYLCEKCDQKRTTLKRMCIKSLPPVLTIQLKRFDYDWEENRALKFNDHFQFPLKLDMFRYTAAGLSSISTDVFDTSTFAETPGNAGPITVTSPECIAESADTVGPIAKSYGSSSNLMATGSPMRTPTSPAWKRLALQHTTKSDKYELVGVVVHSGQANAGHYYSIIKERRDVFSANYGKWFKFNDTTVDEVKLDEHFMETELFGGRYRVDKSSLFNDDRERERYWNAYLLFYARVDEFNEGITPTGLTHNTAPRHLSHSVRSNAHVFGEHLSVRSPSTMAAGGSIPGVTPNSNRAVAGGTQMAAARRALVQPGKRSVSLSVSNHLVDTQPDALLRVQPVNGTAGGVPASVASAINKRRDSFSDLPALVEQAEKNKLFRFDAASIPTDLLEEIREENMRFARNRGIYCVEYFRLMETLCSDAHDCLELKLAHRSDGWEELSMALIEFCGKFAFNVAWHTKRALRGSVVTLRDIILDVVTSCPSAADWLLTEMSSLTGEKMIESYLFDCDLSEVRRAFADCLLRALLQRVVVLDEVPPVVDKLIGYLLGLVKTIAGNQVNQSGSLFRLFNEYAMHSLLTCEHLLKSNAMRTLLEFLVDVPPTTGSTATLVLRRRWSQTQSRDLHSVYNTMAVLVLYSDLSSLYTTSTITPRIVQHTSTSAANVHLYGKLRLDESVHSMIAGVLCIPFVKELLWAHDHVHDASDALTQCCLHAAYNNFTFSNILIQHMLNYIAQNVSYNRTLSLLGQVMVQLPDDLESKRIALILDGPDSDGVLNDLKQPLLGLLDSIQYLHATDSRRCYTIVKMLNNAVLSNSSSCVKDALSDPKRKTQWEFGVLWLKERMHGKQDDSAGTSETHQDASVNASVLWDMEQGTTSPPLTSSHRVTFNNDKEQLDELNKAELKLNMTLFSGMIGPAERPKDEGSTSRSSNQVVPTTQSNEDFTGRSFQRTVSAQYTLETASRMLSEIDASSDVPDEDNDDDTGIHMADTSASLSIQPLDDSIPSDPTAPESEHARADPPSSPFLPL